jgi:hypothetical protein
MRPKSTIIGPIAGLLAAAFFFCAGMHYTLTHMTIEADEHGDSAIITLNDNVYVHSLDYSEPLNID